MRDNGHDLLESGVHTAGERRGNALTPGAMRHTHLVAIAPDGRSLTGTIVQLDRTVPADADELLAALDDDRVWASGYWGGQVGRPATAADWVARLPGDGEPRVQYTVRLTAALGECPAGAVIGTSSIGRIDVDQQRAEIGWTAYAPSVWSTTVNPDCKLALLRHCFDDCGLGRVAIRTDAINTRSQAAIAKLGAVREGVLRRHQRRGDGTFRDTVVFSVIVDEWPAVSDGLQCRLAGGGLPTAGTSSP